MEMEVAYGDVPFYVTLEGTQLLANGHPFLTHVPSNITSTPFPFISKDDMTRNAIGSFVGFNTAVPKSLHVATVGKLRNITFMSIFRFKVWWSTHWIGKSGKDMERETQIMILDKSRHGRPYVLLLPILEGPFRASLQPGKDDDLDMCIESGSTKVLGSTFRSCLYIHVGNDPYHLVNDGVNVVKNHLRTFNLLQDKTVPGVVDKFGWSTWDAFYREVNPKGIWEGVKGLTEGGCPPALVLIDDGWQSISYDEDPDEETEDVNYGGKTASRLIKFQEKCKFREYKSDRLTNKIGMGAFVSDLKDEFKSIKYVYVWHGLCGHYGGLQPNFRGVSPGSCRLVRATLTEALQLMMEDSATGMISNHGIGLVEPDKVWEMYQGLHSHIAAAGIDGVKVDYIHMLEMLAEEYGGRVELAKAYYNALTASVRKHFGGNNIIASMQQCNDFMYLGTKDIALGRTGDDYWPTDRCGDPKGTYWLQGCHLVHCAYNSLWMGNFIHPDWDMFQSTHPCAEFHAASRAISGGPVYVSDGVGNHNFDLLKALVLPDGSILRCQSYALPTRDSLFLNPLNDGKSMLKIWNLNKFTGVIGAFNCQGGGWCTESRRHKRALEVPPTVTCLASPKDVEWNNGNEKKSISTKGVDVFAIHFHKQKIIKLLKATESLEITLQPITYEILTVSPVRILEMKSVQFAPIGLVNMLNSGGAIESLKYDDNENKVKIGVRGCGEMRVFASEKPGSCLVNGVRVEFGYDDHMVVVQVTWPGSLGLSEIEYLF